MIKNTIHICQSVTKRMELIKVHMKVQRLDDEDKYQ